MKKFMILSASLLLFASLACLKPVVDTYSTISFMVGDVTLNNVDASIGLVVNQKDVIKTGKNSFCDIKIGDSLIRIKENSRVLFSELIKDGSGEQTTLGLNVGKMLCKPKKLLKSEKFIVKTPTAVAGVRGTKFTIQADMKSNTMIKVFDGKVKIAKRIKQFEDRTDKILEIASTINKQEKVVITKEETMKAEKAVDKIVKFETAKAKGRPVIFDTVLRKARNDVLVGKADIKKFTGKDYVADSKEIIDVKEKPKMIVNLIVRAIRREKIKPNPDGMLLITHFEVYYIKGGKIRWEGKVGSEALKRNGKIFIAAGDYVFCAKEDDGEVQWRKKLENDGKLNIKDNKLLVLSGGKEIQLDLETGQQL